VIGKVCAVIGFKALLGPSSLKSMALLPILWDFPPVKRLNSFMEMDSPFGNRRIRF
jgi:hypothetical protein